MRRSLVGFFLGVLLVAGGYLYLGMGEDRSPDRSVDRTAEPSREATRPEWTIEPAPRTGEDTRPEAPGSTVEDTGLTIPGSVRFAEGSGGDSVQLRVSVLAVRTPLPEVVRTRLAENPDHASIDELLEVVRREGIGPEELDRYVGERRTLGIHTNERGEFTLTRAPPGLYRIESRDPVWTGESGDVVLELPGNVRSLTLDVRGSKTFRGRVTDPDGNPLENVEVTFEGNARDPMRTSRSGTFVVGGVPPSRPINFLRLHKPGYEPISVSRPPLGDTDPGPVTFRMRRGTYLEVSVEDEEEQPVTSGVVELTRLEAPAKSSGPLRPIVERIDDRGIASFAGVDPGSYALRLRSGNYFLPSKKVTLEPKEQRRIEAEAKRGRVVTVRYRDAVTGEAVEGIHPSVEAYDEAGEVLSNGFRLRNRPRKDRYRGLLHPEAREIVVRSRPSGNQPYRPDRSRFDLRNADTVTVEVEPSGGSASATGFVRYRLTLSGPVSDGALAEARASLHVLNRTTGRTVLERTTGAAPEWPVPLPSAELLLYGTVTTPEGDYVVARELSPRPSGSEPRVTLELQRPATLEGRVNGSDDTAGVGTVGVSLLDPRLGVTGDRDHLYVDVPRPLTATVGEDGRFTVDNLPPDRRLHLLGVRSGTRLAPGSPLIINRSLSPFSPNEHREPSPISQ